VKPCRRQNCSGKSFHRDTEPRPSCKNTPPVVRLCCATTDIQLTAPPFQCSSATDLAHAVVDHARRSLRAACRTQLERWILRCGLRQELHEEMSRDIYAAPAGFDKFFQVVRQFTASRFRMLSTRSLGLGESPHPARDHRAFQHRSWPSTQTQPLSRHILALTFSMSSYGPHKCNSRFRLSNTCRRS